MKKIILGLFMLVSAIGAAQPGTLDGTFNSLGSGANGSVLGSVIQPDGKIIIGGQFTSYNGSGKNRIARLNADGTLDASFITACNALVRKFAIQSDGKVIMVGNFVTVNGSTGINRIARLNADGSLDSSFTSGVAANLDVHTVNLLPDGKILIGGDFTEYNGVVRNSIARLNSDGTLDSSFDPGAGADERILNVKIQTDGKILISGEFNFYDGTSRRKIARLNADGSLDTSFNPGTGTNSDIFGLAIQSDGKILIGGNFINYNGVSKSRIARLNSDGSLDNSFTTGTGADKRVYEIITLSDGKIVMVGNFDVYNGTSRNKMAVLNSDGTLNTSFNIGTGFVGLIRSIIKQQPNDEIIVGGEFTNYNGTAINRIARINTIDPIAVTKLASFSCGATVGHITNVYAQPVTLATGYKFNIYDASGSNLLSSIDSPNKYFRFSQMAFDFGATYIVKVQVKLGNFFGLEGAACSVTLNGAPTTTLASFSCGATVNKITNVYSSVLFGAGVTGYIFNIYDASGDNLIGSVETSNNYFRFSEINFDFGTTYSVKVQVKIDGSFGAEGAACNVTLTVPTTTLESSSCGVTVSPTATNVYAISVLGATGYKFNIYDATGTTLITSLDKSTNYFRFNEFAYVAGASYMVKVQVIREAVIGAEGAACKVTLTGEPAVITRSIELPFTAVAYPNPFANSFSLDVKSSYKSALDIKVYDMLGRLVEQKSANVNELETITIGATYPAGIYNVMVTQDDETKVVRVIKR